jgi:hypothetical protein
MFDDALGEEELMTVSGLDGLGEYGSLYDYDGLYQAPDGSVYQMQGLDDDPDGMRDGYVGEICEGPDGRLYQWVEGYDGLGDPIGFWSLLPAAAKVALPLAARYGPRLLRRRRRLLRRVMPPLRRVLQQVAVAQPVPLVMPSMPAAPADSDETAGMGALYQAPDGSIYQVQGFAEDDRLSEEDLIRGLDEDDQLAEEDLIRGLDEDDQLAEEDLVRGLDEDDRLSEEHLIRGLDEDDRLSEEEALRDVDGYVREDGVRGLDAYIQPEPPHTPMFVRPALAPDMWRPLW